MDELLAIFKRHKRFLLVVAPTLIGALVIYSMTVPSARGQAQNAQDRARAAQHEIVNVVSESFKKFESLHEGSLTDAVAGKRHRVAELEAYKEELLRTLAYHPPTEFRLPGDFSADYPADYQRWFDRFLRELQDDYVNDSPAPVELVRNPRLNVAGLLDELNFAYYLEEAQAWAGVVEPPSETRSGASPYLRRGPSGPRSPQVATLEPENDAEQESPEARAQRELEAARADVRMRLVLLSIINKVIYAGFVEEPLRIENIQFIQRGRETTERFEVSTEGACFFRPIRLSVEVEATEPALMEFLIRCIEPGENRQFLSLDRLQVIAAEALLAEPQSDRVRAEVEFLAFLIDPEQPFRWGKDEESRAAVGQRVPFRR